MPRRYVPVERDQQFLMPPSLAEWLPEDDLAFFVVNAVKDLDLSGFHARRPEGTVGRPSFDPEMMVALILHAYARGIRSSRQIESALVHDVGFKVVTANHKPDHATIARFRAGFEAELEGLFVGVLALCVNAGLVDPRLVALDGTKMAADASASRNVSRDALEEFAHKVFEDAARIDAEEDELYGKDKRGDELRDDLKDPEVRKRWIREQLEEMGLAKGSKKKVNLTDPDSQVMKTPQGYLQGFNAQTVVTEAQIVVASAVTTDNCDYGQLVPMLTLAADNLAAAGSQDEIATAVADNGYLTTDNLDADLPIDLLIAPTAKKHLAKAVAELVPDCSQDDYVAKMEAIEAQTKRRIEVLTRANAKEITMKQAHEELGLRPAHTYVLARRLRERGPEALTPKMMPRRRRPGPKHRMLERFKQPGALETYAVRAQSVEPVFGHTKHNRGFSRFMRRGQSACNSEFNLIMATHNLLKLWSASKRVVKAKFSDAMPCHYLRVTG